MNNFLKDKTISISILNVNETEVYEDTTDGLRQIM